MANNPKTHPEQMTHEDDPHHVVAVVAADSQQGKSRQGAALAMKALSFQKRQCFTNCCCIAACPLLMVLISAILGTVIAGTLIVTQVNTGI